MRKLPTALPVVVLLFSLLWTAPSLAQRCGKERWSVKTGTDANAQQVDLANPKPMTIAELVALTPPHPIPSDTRVSPTEDTVFVVNATLTDYKLEGGSTGDSDYHLVLQDDQGNTMVAEIPSPSCVGNGSPFAAQIASARAEFDSQLTAGSSFRTADIPVRVTGIGFFDFAHGQRGAAPNVIELHPILDIVFNPQANGGADFSISAPPSPIQVAQSGSGSVTISAIPTHGTLPNITLSTSGLPTGVQSHLTPLTNGKSTLTLSVSAATPAGTFPFVITGTGDAKSHSQAATLEVTTSPQPPNGQEWEYQVISASSEQDVVDQANRLGTQEWELVSVVRVQGNAGWKAFFRRPRRNF